MDMEKKKKHSARHCALCRCVYKHKLRTRACLRMGKSEIGNDLKVTLRDAAR